MSLTGTHQVQTSPSSDNTLENIKNLLMQKNFQKVRLIIASCTEEKFAAGIYNEIFPKMLPGCWLAFLQNPNLNHVLGPRELISIMNASNAAVSHQNTNQAKKKYFHLVMVAIARNTNWCKMLSYRFFLDYILNSKDLLEHVIFDLEFMTHLDYVHMAKLFDLITEVDDQKVILEYLDDVLDGSYHYQWALYAIEYMFIHCPTMCEKISQFQCETITAKLQAAFLQNKHFAISVLKNPQLYAFFGIESTEAYQHSLLNMNDFKEIAMHFKKSDTLLFTKYAIIHVDLAAKECQASLETLTIKLSQELVITPSFDRNNEQHSLANVESQAEVAAPSQGKRKINTSI